MRTSQCRSCKATIIWAMTENDKWMPLDPKTVKVGNRYRITTSGASGQSLCLRVTEDGVEGHEVHWATCPNAKQHKKKSRSEGL